MVIFLSGISPNTSPGDIKALLGPYSEHVDVKIPVDRATRRQRTFAFVMVPDDRAAYAAIEALHGSVWGDRALEVREAHVSANLPRNWQPGPYSER